MNRWLRSDDSGISGYFHEVQTPKHTFVSSTISHKLDLLHTFFPLNYISSFDLKKSFLKRTQPTTECQIFSHIGQEIVQRMRLVWASTDALTRKIWANDPTSRLYNTLHSTAFIRPRRYLYCKLKPTLQRRVYKASTALAEVRDLSWR